jgi:hypothetical protein
VTNRIKHRAGSGFTLGSQEYPTLKELLKARKKDLGLKVLHLLLTPPFRTGTLSLTLALFSTPASADGFQVRAALCRSRLAHGRRLRSPGRLRRLRRGHQSKYVLHWPKML